ncbi:Interferon-induced GTP-binding protein Mx2 [Colletotrichum chlorophyti]|uniref:Interferon-induced GTP-binding protein Mx2 n=1 Tax=Colletotrichum chlorophyti TaxID=708187 RepID=A0A1Q8S6N0_9PEZI|nr:Interferon-induced GTP-binding protein Mx2 [Colletotrichum chlorophyti]
MTMTTPSPDRPPGLPVRLQSNKSSERLSQIDKLRANGISDLIDLPQLVVCGDQSVGKSSVLEGITGIPFPRKDGLCTRFPTEIILRHSSAPFKANATIRPHNSREASSQKVLQKYQHEMQEDLSDLPVVIEQVSRLIGVRGFSNFADAPAFASDALRIEVTGSIGMQLSVVDLPGLITVSNEEQSETDVEAVHNMVRDYLANSRTIILAVVQASNDVANQGIVRIAREYDADGRRTVGIITKPDLINDGAEAKVALIAKNLDSIKLKLGFFLLKNPSPSDLKAGRGVRRSQLEMAYFSTPTWKAENLDMSRVGVDKLRIFLQDLLDTHIETELPKVRDEIKRLLADKEEQLKAMGPERRKASDVRLFMTEISMRFYQLCQAALQGNYDQTEGHFFSERDICRLRATVHKRNSRFSDDVRTKGEKRTIRYGDPHAESDSDSTNEVSGQLRVTEDDMMTWVQQTYLKTRGRELPGNYNNVLLSELFHEQSSPWRNIAEQHVSTVLEDVSLWVEEAIDNLVHEERLRREVFVLCNERLGASRTRAFEELNKILSDENKHPITYNHYYTDNIQKARHDSQKQAVRQALRMATAEDWKGKCHISNLPEDMDRLLNSLQLRICVDMERQACNEALAGLKAYYKVAMKTFVDNVCRQVIERHIMTPLPETFSPTTIAHFSEAELLRIGSEQDTELARRSKLDVAAQGLRRSLQDLQA